MLLILVTALADSTGLLPVLGAAGSTAMVALALAAALAPERARGACRLGLLHGHAPAGTLAWFARRETRALQAPCWPAGLLLLAASSGWASADGPLLAMHGGAVAAATGRALKATLITRAVYMPGARIPHTPARGRGDAGAVLPVGVPRHGPRRAEVGSANPAAFRHAGARRANPAVRFRRRA